MSSSVRALTVGVLAVALGLPIALVIAGFEIATDVGLFELSVAVVIPLGAIGCGVVAAAGFYAFLRSFHVRPSGVILAVPPVTAVTTLLASRWLVFRGSDVSGDQTYVETLTSWATAGLGGWGYGVVVLELIGFAMAGWFVAAFVLKLTWCERCHRFPKLLGREIRYFDEPTLFEASANRLVDILERGGPAEAYVYAVAEKPVVKRRSEADFRLTTEHFECKKCGTLHTVISTDRMVSSNWSRLSQTPLHIEAEQGSAHALTS